MYLTCQQQKKKIIKNTPQSVSSAFFFINLGKDNFNDKMLKLNLTLRNKY